MASRAYLRLDPNVRRRKRHYSDAHFRAFIEILCLADGQPWRGRFESETLLRAWLGPKLARQVAVLKESGDLMPAEEHRCGSCPPRWKAVEGELYVDGWDTWQEADMPVHQRMAAVAERQSSGAGPVPGAVRTATWRMRRRVFERDQHVCRYCGNARYPRQWLVAEHPNPFGPSSEGNLVTACRSCNKVKGARTPEQAGMPLLESGERRSPPIRYGGVGSHVPSDVTNRDLTGDVTPSQGDARHPSDGPRNSRGRGRALSRDDSGGVTRQRVTRMTDDQRAAAIAANRGLLVDPKTDEATRRVAIRALTRLDAETDWTAVTPGVHGNGRVPSDDAPARPKARAKS